MAISVNWSTKIITVPKADTTLVQASPEIRGLDIDTFRLALKDLEDGEGMPFLDTHSHNTAVTVGGVTLARVVQVINGYTITFEDGQYAVNLTGANSNISDVANVNQVSIRSANSAGLVQVTSSSGLSASEQQQLADIEKRVKADAVHDDTNVTIYEEGTSTVIVTKDVTTTGNAGLSSGDSVSIRKP
jgi:hypothetical protein